MNSGQSIKTVYSKYATFSGRASRSEFWWFFLFYVLVYFVLSALNNIARAGSDTTTPAAFILWIFVLGTIVPLLAVYSRRLHDTGRSAAWLFLLLLPIIGAIVVLVLCAMEGQSGPNQYGDDPVAAGRPGTYPGQYGQPNPYGGQ
ncbi:DUF805 domain-containing protein [uncultured Propionibacterium sp.]|uniref:DUF805 domain-containing protein n=1 Tax=uncultured Propionibacterium sp. TaxID=218066 RepID=UPI0029301574|nr:DUF805 domain-containing protein [uncultured Propionibacterium sp.]